MTTKEVIERQKHSVEWNQTPPPMVTRSTHKFSLIDSIEEASTKLRTDYAAQTETLIVGGSLRTIITSLPEAVLDKPEKVGESGLIKLGSIGLRPILLDWDHSMDDCAYLDNGKESCKIEVVSKPVPIQSVFTAAGS